MVCRTAGRFHTLDAMRGIAAIAVVIFHVGTVMGLQVCKSGYLAVDFFFVLSGFVLARAYEMTLKSELSFWRFIAMRLIRLYPLLALGVLFGAITVVGQIAEHSPTALNSAAASAAFVFNALMLPAVTSPGLFPFDGPAWSLFFELVINAIFAAILYRTNSSLIAIFCVASGALYF
jgi:peptidoglycan/LPS O-acetylase OafA/YrhL